MFINYVIKARRGGGCKLKYDRGEGGWQKMSYDDYEAGGRGENLSQHYNIKVIHESHQIYPLTKK